jgi:5-methyltetrahydrofolate--homocysteine methyltransferase
MRMDFGLRAIRALTHDELIGEKYTGIRAARLPAVRTTASNTPCLTCWAGDIGMALTESLAMTPAASVGGSSATRTAHFNVGRSATTSCMIWRSAGASGRKTWRLLANL